MTTHTSMISVGALLWATAALATPPAPPISLNTCQGAVKTAAKAYQDGYVTAVTTCLQAISTQIVQNNAATAAAAASTCATQFRNIYDTRGAGLSLAEKLTTAVNKKCAPGMLNVTHTLQDILGAGAGVAQPIDATNINAWCAHFGGDGSIDTLQEWTDCIAASHTCPAQETISTQYPRALEWLALVRPPMAALTPPATDPTKISNALAGLDAVVAAIDGPDHDGEPNIECGSSCGDGVKNGSEACDGSDLSGATCTSLGYANGTLSCTASCGLNTSGCNCRTATGNAAVGDVLSGKTFSNNSLVGATGTMPNNGAANFTPGAAAVPVPAGYYSGGQVNTDASLVSGNIKSGATIFGVPGSSVVVNTSTGTATAADMLSGKTAFVNGSQVTGSVPAGANVNGANGSKTFTIPDGLYSGSKTATANDANLVGSNITSGVSILGVAGTALPASPLKTGQTQCDQGAGTLGACPGTPAGQDASLSKGVARSYTDNGDGTITDNKTGLMWEKLSRDGTIHDYSNSYTWYTAFTTKIATLNSGGGFAGHTDWRLPNRFELEMLADLGRVGPAIDPAFNTGCVASCTVTSCSCTQSYSYWSSTTYQTGPGEAWLVGFYDGLVGYDFKSPSGYVRAVRAGL